MVGRPKATDPIIQRNFYLPRSRAEALEATAKKLGQRPTDIVNGLVLDWLDKMERESEADNGN